MKSGSARLRSFMPLFRSRLSWRIVFWIFLSITVIEAVLLVPSVERRRQELIDQVEEVSDGKVDWILATYPEATGAELFEQVQQLYGNPMLEGIIGGAVYAPDNSQIGTFGEPPLLTPATTPQARILEGTRFDAAWPAELTAGEHTIIIRHNVQGLRRELVFYILRLGALMLVISAFVTLVMMIVLWPNLISPVLILRRDLVKAGESVCCDNFEAEFASSQFQRQDELGEVIAAFEAMYTRICQAVSARKRIEGELRSHNDQMRQYLEQVDRVTQAAAALETGQFAIADLDDVATRSDELGQLARVFQQSAKEVQQREATLQRQVSELKIEIDQVKRQREVSKITQSGYFQEVQKEVAAVDLDAFWA